MIKRFVYIPFLLFSLIGVSQAPITDNGVLACLTTDYSELVINSNQLDTVAAGYKEALNCNGYGIADASFLLFFDSIQQLHLEDNAITNFPNLSVLTALNFLQATGNQVTELPVFPSTMEYVYFSNNDIDGTIDLGPYPMLRHFYMGNNHIDSLIGLEGLVAISQLGLGTNELVHLDPLSNLDKLTHFYMSRNKLSTIGDLNLDAKLRFFHVGNNMLQILPKVTLASDADVRAANNGFTFEDLLGLVDQVQLDSLDFSYSPQDSREVELRAMYNQGDELIWEIPFDQDISSNYYLWYKDSILVDSTTTGLLAITDLKPRDSGSYYCLVKNTTLNDLTISIDPISVTVYALPNDDEPLIVSPNGDGESDTYYFNGEGSVAIYDRLGKMIRNFDAPFLWDGNAATGKTLPIGTYVITIDGEFFNQVTIIR